jgi:hypothetical protein
MDSIYGNEKLIDKLNYFLQTKQIPNIIFHGSSGSGKRSIVNKFLLQIYGGDKVKLKSNVMMVNCSHGKGIKFIREELKFFAKTNIQSSYDIMFKSIVLFNADSLTIDAQSALRRCIESFSYNTRFFIVIENKQKLLNPILSRFCEMYISEPTCISNVSGVKVVKFVNLHKQNLDFNYQDTNAFFCSEGGNVDEYDFFTVLKNIMKQFENKNETFELPKLIDLSTELYENGIYVKQLIDNLDRLKLKTNINIGLLTLCYYKLRSEFRCEKLLFFFILKYVYHDLSSNHVLKNMLLI